MQKKRYNKYTQITARAVRQSLKENERLASERRGLTSLRYQHWEGGKGGEQVSISLRSWFQKMTIVVCRCTSTRLSTSHRCCVGWTSRLEKYIVAFSLQKERMFMMMGS